MKTSFMFELSEIITYTEDGAQREALEVEVFAPSKKLYKKTYLLQQIVTQALLKAQEIMPSGSGEGPEEEHDISGKDMKMILLAGGGDVEACISQVQKLGKEGCIKVGGNPINFIQWDKIEPMDQEKIVCEFLANFTFPLVMTSLTS